MNKKALTIKETLELILAVGAAFLLIFLIYKLISPNFDKDDETLKSYLETLKSEIKKADNNQIGEFEILPIGETNFYVVYFGDKISFKNNEAAFSVNNLKKNKICICYSKSEKNKCECESLSMPASFSGNDGQWILEKGKRVEISKKDKYYDFKLKNLEAGG